jgi:ligand-binding sensor domain-containing protein/signal transduction histidine kinase
LDPHHSLSQYGRQVWQTENGLPQNTIHAVVQTRDGTIWLGTDDGLVRFDGSEFKVFTVETTPALRNSAVEGLTADAAGRLWVVTTAGLAVYEAGRFREMGPADGLPSATVWFVHADNRERVWVATADGLCVMGAARCEAVAATKGMSVTRESRFAEAPDGSIWLAEGPLTKRLDSGLLAVRETLQSVGGTEIAVQQVDRAGGLLVGTQDGLQIARDGALVPVELGGMAYGRVAVSAMAQAPDGSSWFGTSAGLVHGTDGFGNARVVSRLVSQAPVQTLFVGRSGAVWAGTSRGVMRMTGERPEEFRAGDALAGSALLSFLEDREGNIWLGSEADGLTVLHDQKFTTYTTADGLSGNVVRSVFQDAAGQVWIGTDGAGLNRRTQEGFAALTTKDGLSSDVVLALAGGADGNLWVGTPTGLDLIRAARETAAGAPRIQVFTTADGLADDFIRSLLVDRSGEVWVGTRHGLTRIAVGGAMTTYTAMDGLGSDFIGAILETQRGDLWIGTSGGLSRLHAGKFTNFKLQEGLARNVVTSMLEDGSGTLWLGTSGGGLSRLRDGVIVPVPATNLPQAISGVLEDREGRLWISARSGIFRVAEAALNRAIEQGSTNVALAAYDTADGMRIREASNGGHPAAVRMRDGTMWFATLRGVSVADPEHLHENAVPPPVALETVLVNDVPQPVGRELVLAPGSQRVEFQFAGLSFVAPQKVEYRYWLEGFDPYWVEAGTHRAAFYTNLRPGQYVFHVAAANNDGVWSETDATIRLRVRPFFWQTWWFYTVLLLAAAGLAYLVYARRVRRVQVQYQGVMEERGRIAREIHDTLAQGIVSISLQLEVVTRLMGTSVEAARAQLDETRALVRQSLADARSSIWDLRTEGTQELPVRLGNAVKMLTASGDPPGKLTVTGSYRAIGRGLEDELLRIGQEAVTNAVRHASSSLIEVMLAYDMKSVRLVVRDNGQGFDASGPGPAGHFGLQGMRERAEKIRARMEVESERGKGTQVLVELPID